MFVEGLLTPMYGLVLLQGLCGWDSDKGGQNSDQGPTRLDRREIWCSGGSVLLRGTHQGPSLWSFSPLLPGATLGAREHNDDKC